MLGLCKERTRGAERRGKVIHWAFLVPVFVAGFMAGYAFLYQMAKVMAQVDGAIEGACQELTF